MSGPKQRVIVAHAERLSSVLERLGERNALVDGRVFVDGRRAENPDTELPKGARVEIYAPREGTLSATILHVEAGLAFVEKPVGIATEPEKRGARTCLVQRAAEALGVRSERVHALSRLDVGVSGVVLLAFEGDAQKRVQRAREQGNVRRRYVAIARGVPEPASGRWTEPIGSDTRGPLRKVRPDGEPARTNYRVCGALGGEEPASVLAFEPETGRTHQLRVHAAAHGAPLYGDRSYGGPARIVSETGAVTELERVYLHAAWISVPGVPRVASPLPEEFRALWSSLGGDVSALDAACESAEGAR